MAVTVTNVKAAGYVSLPLPFGKTLSAGGTASVADVMLSDIEPKNLQRLKDMENAGYVTVVETDDAELRGSLQDASIADVKQLISIGEGTASTSAQESVVVVDRECTVESITCWFDAVPAATETITITLTRNGQSILNAAFVVDDGASLPSESGVPLAGAADQTDGAVLAADPDEFNSAGFTFTAAHVGNVLLLNSGGTNDGAYIIDGYTDGSNVDCTQQDGSDPAFTDESGIEWDMILALQPGDILVLGGVMANVTNVSYWCAQVALRPR